MKSFSNPPKNTSEEHVPGWVYFSCFGFPESKACNILPPWVRRTWSPNLRLSAGFSRSVTACLENAKRNAVDDKMAAWLPDQIGSESQQPPSYDLVIANILAEVIIELRDTLLVHLKPGGRLLLTGILNTQADKVIAAFGNGYTFDKQIRDQWCLLVSK